MPKFSLALICTVVAAASTSLARAQATMTPLATFGTSGWIAPGTSPYVTTGNTERGLSYNPTTGNLVLVARQNVGGISNNVRILDGATGADLFGLDNTGITGGTFAVNMVDVAANGAIYVGNLSTSATSNFKVYKWDSEALGASTPPSIAYDALTGLARTGDSFAVSPGTPSNPERFASAGSNNVNASNFAVGSLDALNTTFAYQSIAGTTTTSNDYRLGMTWVDDATVIGNQGATARLTSFDAVTATVDASIPLGGAARRALDYTVIGLTPVLAVIDSNSSLVTVFDVSDPTAPIALVSGTTTSGVLTANANGTGAVAWGTVNGDTAVLYAMASNQGIQAFTVTLSPLANQNSYGMGCDNLHIATNGMPTIGNSLFELDVLGVPPVSPIAFVAFGTMAIDPGIPLASIGMAGCFGYQNLDLGLFATGPVAGGQAVFPLPLPPNASLAGASLATQALTLSLLTAAGLASSHGLQFVVGF